MPIPAAAFMPVVGSLIGAGANIWDSAREAQQSRYNVNRTIQANKEAAELAYQRNVEMWNMQNSYNSPEAQMQRFKAAGLNPHLIYGQGNPGNAQAPPAYQPPEYRYAYETTKVAPAITSILPMMMEVGSWMQDMRLKDAALAKTQVETEKVSNDSDRIRQMIEFLHDQNPELLRRLQNQNSLFPYQKDMQRYNTDLARQTLFQFEQDFRYKYGEGLFDNMGSAFDGKFSDIDGAKRIEFLYNKARAEKMAFDAKVSGAKASWSDFSVTDPQALVQLVLSGVMGLAGQHIRVGGRPRTQTMEKIERMRNGRQIIRRDTKRY